VGTPTWQILLQASLFGFFSSLQFTSMNTLVCADVSEDDTSMASTIVSTVQQMALSFGVATASLATSIFIPDQLRASPNEMIHGLHHAFYVLGGFTLLSTFVFRTLKPDDGANISLHKANAGVAAVGH
jgi:hypothetical protein